jgi:acyl CoA:acetate/3-ketoacid CoA transferase alpha subunit
MTRNKVVDLSEAAASIEDGSSVTIGGFGVFLQPMAMMRELVRQRKRNLELLSLGEAYAADLLVGGGCVNRVTLGSFGFEAVTGRTRNFCRAVEQGTIEVEDYSHFAMASRFLAGATGLPFAAVRSMLGSNLLKDISYEKRFEIFTCPFSGEKVVLLPAIKPQVAIIHAQRADREGNIQVFGPTICIEEKAKAASRVIAVVEEVVPRSVIQVSQNNTLVPSFVVDTVVVMPYGAHPVAVYGCYDYDLEHLYEYTDASRNPKTWQAYLDRYIFGAVDHFDYLERIGGLAKISKLRADPMLGY